MYLSYCSLRCAFENLKKLETESDLIADARHQLALAIFYAEAYEKTWNSIHWNSATSAAKRRVREKLNRLAFDAYSAFLVAIADINSFCDRQHEKECQGLMVVPIPVWWNDMLISLTLAHDAMVREHGREISSRQLHLFEQF
jgi:hypothetical protein